MLYLLVALAGQISPRALCPDAKPSSAACCYHNKTAPVLGGVDFVDLAMTKQQGEDPPTLGDAKFARMLNGYFFHFINEKNADTFSSNPWAYAPSWGGF